MCLYSFCPPDAPKLPSVSVSPSAEIVEGSSVTLTCSSDANPAATYTWLKSNVKLRPPIEEQQLVLMSIQSSHSGQYTCRARNKKNYIKSHLCLLHCVSNQESNLQNNTVYRM
uniref:Ig-like domain-containing protein n=1 Tax=Sander lucioperca TaxID=283035 RepID=A0A8D0AD75_SANLU